MNVGIFPLAQRLAVEFGTQKEVCSHFQDQSHSITYVDKPFSGLLK